MLRAVPDEEVARRWRPRAEKTGVLRTTRELRRGP